MATVTLETVLARLDQMQGQLWLMRLRQTELEDQIRSVGRLWTLMQDFEDKIRPDAAVQMEEDQEDLVG